ncbi:MAG: DUF2244 domain-containing protein [Albidovulum sp.]
MPYEWVKTIEKAPAQSGAFCVDDDSVVFELHLWPYRSLPRKGFVIFIGITVAMLAFPLMAVIGSVVLWALLPFLALAVAGMWWALARSYRDGEVLEVLRIGPDRCDLTRQQRGQPTQHWQANPYWVGVRLHLSTGPVPNYLTLKGNGREVEIGSFLSEDERIALKDELERHLALASAPLPR